MSHFCTLVFCKDKGDVERLLAPFQEYDDQDGFPKEWLCFVEDEDFEIDEETGKPGFWENPNAIWDWYSVGGRYKKCFKLKEGGYASFGKIANFDFSITNERKQEFDREWEIVVNGAEKTEKEKHILFYCSDYYLDQWGNKDVFMTEMCNSYGWNFITPDGKLHSKGKELWFGCSEATRESRKKYVKEWQETIENIPQDYYMVVVDCHI